MHLKEAIDKSYNLAVNNGIGQYEGSYEQAFDMVIEELEKKDKEYEELTEVSKELCKTVNLMKKVINEMAKHIHLSGDYKCLNKECEDDGIKDCEECIKEYFYNEVEKEGIKE